MKILWTYLKPYRWLILLSLSLASAAQLLSLVDPIIFGMIIDDYALQQDTRPESELVSGVLRLLAIALAVALLSRFARAMQDYVVKLIGNGSASRSSTTASARRFGCRTRNS